jgi:hypothetical protein
VRGGTGRGGEVRGGTGRGGSARWLQSLKAWIRTSPRTVPAWIVFICLAFPHSWSQGLVFGYAGRQEEPGKGPGPGRIRAPGVGMCRCPGVDMWGGTGVGPGQVPGKTVGDGGGAGGKGLDWSGKAAAGPGGQRRPS